METPIQGGPTRTSRALAMVHLAMYDAWRAYNPTIGAPYLANVPPKPATGSGTVAVGAAAYCLLMFLYFEELKDKRNRANKAKENNIRAFLQTQKNGWLKHVSGDEQSDEWTFGAEIAKLMIALRKDDCSHPDFSECVTCDLLRAEPGFHRPDPYVPLQGLLGPYWVTSRPSA